MQIRPVISDYIRRSLLTTQGDLVVRGAAVPERLVAGAAGRLLTAQGAASIPKWEVPSVVNTTRPAYSAAVNAEQSNKTGDGTVFSLAGDFWTERFDQRGNLLNGLFTAPLTGIYAHSLSLNLRGLADAHTDMYVRCLSTAQSYYPVACNPGAAREPNDELIINMCILADMSKDDTAYWLFMVSGGVKTIDVRNVYTRMQGYLIC